VEFSCPDLALLYGDKNMSDRQKDEKTIFRAAVQLKTPAERTAYIDKVCGADLALKARIMALLQAHEDKGDFLEGIIEDLGVTLDDSPLTEAPGTVIGNYKLLEQIGEGGMAVVYMAEQKEPIRRKVALKIIKLGMDTKEVIARFEVERQSLAVMDHPNIAKVLDAGATETGRPFFVMELVRGMSISKYCDKNKLNTKERLDLFVQVCNAVQHAHQKGIIHRDIKPSNVMITLRDGKPVPKVIDFGIAKATSRTLTEKTLFTRYAQMIGTPAYMSPEQAEFSELDIDTRTDIYSLGVLLYELLTGATPFSEEQLREAGYVEMQRIISEEEPLKPSTKLSTLGDTLTDVAEHRKASPDLLQKLVRGDLDWIVMMSLEKDRTRRYETANELAQDIQRHLSDEPVVAGPPSAVYKVKKFVRRNKMALAALCFLVLLGLVAGVFAYREQHAQQQTHKEKRQHAVERAMLMAMSGDFEGAEKAIGEAELLGASHGSVRMIRGQLALHRGDTGQAIEHLEQAVKLLPHSVAAHSLLAHAYGADGQSYRSQITMDAIEKLTAVTPEDYLFKAHAESWFNPRRALKSLDEAIRLQDSTIARLLRAATRSNIAQDTGRPDIAQSSIEDARVAKAMMPENPFSTFISLGAHVVAMGVYEDAGDRDRAAASLLQAGKDAEELAAFPAMPTSYGLRWYYLNLISQEEAAHELARKGYKEAECAETRRIYVFSLYEQGEFEEALQVIERTGHAGGSSSREAKLAGGVYRLQPFIVAELPNGLSRALEAYRENCDLYTKGYEAIFTQAALFFLGRRTEAVTNCRELHSHPERLTQLNREHYLRILDYCGGFISEEEFLKAEAGSRNNQCEAHFYVALDRLAQGDRTGARDHFQKALATRVFEFWEYQLSRLFLKRMEQDPTWPRWLPLQAGG
jgi:serine/threonine protein kinase/Tfp pilus assembly protein PilF